MTKKFHIIKSILVLYVICATYIGFTGSYISIAEILGSATGTIMGAICMSFLFWCVRKPFINTVPKPKFSDKLFKYTAVYLCIYFGSDAYKKYRDNEENLSVLSDAYAIRNEYILESLNEDDGFLQQTSLEFEKDNSNQFNIIIKETLNDRIIVNNEYESKTSDLRLERLFDAQWMSDHSNIQIAKSLIAESVTISGEYFSNVKAMGDLNYLTKKLDLFGMDLSENEKKEFITGWEIGVKNISKFSQLMEDSNTKYLDKLSEFVSFLEKNREDWVVENGIFAFKTSENVVKFNSLFDEIASIERMLSKILLDHREKHVSGTF